MSACGVDSVGCYPTMDAVSMQQRYLKLTKAYLLLTGMWPNQNKYIRYGCQIVIQVITWSSLTVQAARVAQFFSLNLLIQQLSFFLGGVLSLAKQSAYVSNKAKFKALLHGMFNDWDVERPKEEVAIMTSYMDRGAFVVLIYVANAFGCALLFVQLPWWSRVADILMPLNTSRPRTYIIPALYPIDEDKYYYWIIAHMTIIIFCTVSIYTACDTCFIYVVQHACGLLAVAGYLRDIDDIHCGYLLACLGIITAAFSATLVLVSKLDICLEFYQCCSYLVVQLVHLFFLTLQGQFIIDTNNKAYNQIYEGLWYNAAPRTQALYVLALRASLAGPQVTAGGQIPMNLETFAVIIKASVSYFTMMKTA